MKTPETKLMMCTSCQYRAFSRKTGVTCALTQAKPDFDEICPNYIDKGSTVAETAVTPVVKGNPKPAARKNAKKKEEIVIEEPKGDSKRKAEPKPIPAPKQETKPMPAHRPQIPVENKTHQNGTVVNAFIHTLLSICSLIFLSPFNIWMSAAGRLEKQRLENSLDIKKISGTWAILSFIKRIGLDFLFDACILLSFPIGLIFGLVGIFSYSFGIGVITLVIVYFVCPYAIALIHDIILLMLIPIRKFISWGSKPAQYIDINELKENK